LFQNIPPATGNFKKQFACGERFLENIRLRRPIFYIYLPAVSFKVQQTNNLMMTSIGSNLVVGEGGNSF